MENTLATIKSLYPLSNTALARLTGLFYERNFKKGDVVLKAGRIEKSVFFIEKGIARAYSDRPKQEITFWLGTEGDYIISAQSLINNKPGYETIEVLEDSILYEINSDAMIALFELDIELANWSRKLAESELIKLEEKYIGRQFKTASQMYAELIHTKPSLLLRVPLKHIASYLGISQVSLSRIRSEIK